MINLYNSGKFELLGVDVTGKKATAGRFYFRGMPSVYGNGKKVLSIIDGEVIASGHELRHNKRAAHYKKYITVRTRDGLCVTYAYLSRRLVNVGDRVSKGQVIGIEGAKNGIGPIVLVEFRRNDRRIDGYGVLGLHKRGQQRFDFTSDINHEELVCDVCGLSGNMRAYINAHPSAADFWKSVASHLSVEE